MKLFLKTIALTVVMALFAACGSDFELFPEENVAPIANAGASQSVVAGAVVTLDGSASSDDNSDDLTYGWSFTSKPAGSTAVLSNSTAVSPTFTADVAGNYLLSLVVNDGAVSSPASSVTVTATATTSNTAPVATFTVLPGMSVTVGATVSLDGSGSIDDNGDPLTYSWSLTRPTGSSAFLNNATHVNPTFKADIAGTYDIRLIVNDGKVNSTTATARVTAATGNAAPVARITVSRTSVVVGTVVTLDGSGSSDDNSDPLTYSWAFTSYPTSSAPSLVLTDPKKPTFNANATGDYAISLTVNDGKGGSDTEAITVAAVNGPVAEAGNSQSVFIGDPVTLDGSASKAANGGTLSYTWKFTTPTTNAPELITTTDTAKPTFTTSIAGTYVISLVVKEGENNSADDLVTVTVKPFVAVVANAGVDKDVALNKLVTLDGSASTDKRGVTGANGGKLKYTWAFAAAGSKPPGAGNDVLSGANTVSPTFTPTVTGTYKISLQVNDSTDPTGVGITDEVIVRCNLGSITVTW